MILQLTKDESETFFFVINSELHCVMNEWDPDIGRCPNKKRIKDSQHAHTIMDKWQHTQTTIPGANFINLENINACNIDLSNNEINYSNHLLDKNIKECRKELANSPKPYTGVFASINNIMTNAENICVKLNASSNTH